MMDMEKWKRLHFVGIKGIAMAALAVLAKERGDTVSGSDIDEEFPSDEVLAKAGISVLSGFDPKHITKKIDLVVYTGAHGGVDNIEVKTAQAFGIDVLPHGKALGAAMKDKKQISVAGSHGKTTTAAMIATILGDCSYAIGSGEIRGLGLPGHFSVSSQYFVAEADEYVTDPTHDKTPRFLWQTPSVLVVTNIDFDHPDVYESLEDVQQAFLALQKQSDSCVINLDDPKSSKLLSQKNVSTYGFSPESDIRISDVRIGTEQSNFTLIKKGKTLGEFAISVPGVHNISNATAAITTALATGVSVEEIKTRLLAFGGAKRRFEKIGQVQGVTFYDDYAHHPKEIAATLAAVRSWYPKDNIVAIFQPHTYSRTKALLSEFGKAFTEADTVLVTDIYASARENDTLGITGETLFLEVKKNHKNVFYTATAAEVKERLKTIDKGIVLFMGAGDIYTWEKEVMV